MFEKPNPSSSRIVVVGAVVWQSANNPRPTHITPNFGRFLETEEQPYQRPRMKVDETARPLDCGWVTRASRVVVENLEGLRLTLMPTQEQMDEIARRIVKVGADVIVRPGELVDFEPEDVTKLTIRCLKGEAYINLTIIPA
jgi:hypothetical protein